MKKQKGFSIIELMVGLIIGLVLLVGAGGLFSTILYSNVNAVKQQRFQQTVQVLMQLMTSDIRRSGYAKDGVVLTGNPYFASSSCVLLSNSTVNDNQRFYGYKLVGNIVYRNDSLINAACGPDLTGWSPVTDIGYIKVTKLWFDMGKVNLATSYDCSVDPIADTNLIPRITLGVEAVGLYASTSTPVRRCEQVNVQRRNT
jgi:prepilin peptidase dependent protein B